MEAEFSGTAPMTYRLRRDGVEIGSGAITAVPNEDGIVKVPLVVAAAGRVDAGTYVIEVTNAAGTAASRPMSVAVVAPRPPAIVRQPRGGWSDDTIDVEIAGDRPFVVRWLRDGMEVVRFSDVGFFQVGLFPPRGERLLAGTYVAEISNRTGTVTSVPARLVNPSLETTDLPQIVRQPRGQALLPGQGAILRCELRLPGSGTSAFQWRRDGQPIAGATEDAFLLANFTPDKAGRYTLAVTDGVGRTVVSDEAQITVRGGAFPPIWQQPASRTLRPGECATLNVVAEGVPEAPVYQWFKDGAAIPGETRPALVLAAVTAADSGSYYAEVTYTLEQVFRTAVATVDVSGEPIGALAPLLLEYLGGWELIWGGQTEPTLVAGQPLTLAVRVAGIPTPAIQWIKDGVPLPGATGATLTLASLQLSDAGTYAALVTNSAGAVRSAPQIVRVAWPQVRPIFAPWPAAARSIALGGRGVLEATIDSSPTLRSFEWRRNGVRVAGGTQSGNTLRLAISDFTPSIPLGLNGRLDTARDSGAQASHAGTYTVVATNDYGSTTSDPIRVEIQPPDVSGLYYWQESDTAGAALLVTADRRATLVMTSRGRNGPVVLGDIPVAMDGGFAATVPGGAGGFARGLEGLIRGDTWWLTLGLPGLGRRHAAQGPASGWAGYWSASLGGALAGTAHALVSASGDAVVVVAPTAGVGFDRRGKVDADGRLILTSAASGAAMLATRFDAGTGMWSGTLRNAAGTTTLAGTRTKIAPGNRLANIATRGRNSTGGDAMIAGFVVAGPASRPVLVRAIGPTLGAFGLTGVMRDPRLELFRGAERVAANDTWDAGVDGGAVAAAGDRVGAFALPAGSRDAALVSTLTPGGYSVQVLPGATATSADGVALMEVYDAGAGGEARLGNLSTRGRVGRGEDALFAGIVVGGEAPKRLLVRGIGPTLAGLGVGGTLADPVLRVFRNGMLVDENDNWVASEELTAITGRVGAFPLTVGSRDAVLLVTLAPGAYSAQLTGAGGASGVALIEVYEVNEAP